MIKKEEDFNKHNDDEAEQAKEAAQRAYEDAVDETKRSANKELYLDGEVIDVVRNAGHLMVTRIRYKEYTQSYFVYVRIGEAVFAHDLKGVDITQSGITDLVLSQHPGDYIITWSDAAIEDLEMIESDTEESMVKAVDHIDSLSFKKYKWNRDGEEE